MSDGGSEGNNDNVGGLVGLQGLVSGGNITASYARGAVDGGEGDNAFDRVGGLVGLQGGGNITACYATGAVDGGDGVSGPCWRISGLYIYYKWW